MVAGGKLIVGDVDLVALDLKTGQQVWQYQPSVGRWPGTTKQWSDGTTIVGGSPTGQVYAVDVATGAEKWNVTFLGDTNVKAFSPLVSGDTVFVGWTRFTPIPHLQKNGGVAALDAKTGRLLWNIDLPRADSADVTGVWADPDAIVLTPTMVYTQAADDSAYALDRSTGSIVKSLSSARFAVGAFLNPSDVPSLGISGGIIIDASSTLTTITALSTATLTSLWKVPFAFGSPTRISVDGDRVYAGAAAGQFAVYDLTGRLVWTINLGDLRSDRQEGIFFPPAIDGDNLYLPGSHELYALRKL